MSAAKRRKLTVITVTQTVRASYSLEEAARLAGISPEILKDYCQLGLFGPERARSRRKPTFDDDALYELRRFEHYRRYHGVNRRTLHLLWELWREVDRLRAELRFRRGS
jgi:hypothetical protein